jgi:1,4-alpha-glucan branching enzyme
MIVPSYCRNERALNVSVTQSEIESIVNFEEADPHGVLGPKRLEAGGEPCTSVRAYLPRARTAWLEVKGGGRLEMQRVSAPGFFEGGPVRREYKLGYEDGSGHPVVRADPYSFPPTLGETDLYLMGEGKYYGAFEKMGAHLTSVGGIPGVSFAVWAPNARSVAVVGDFNHWTVGENPMRSMGSSGVWELFVPGLEEGEVYKYAIKNRETGDVKEKADPYAFAMEVRPRTGSVVADLEKHAWSDRGWMEGQRKEQLTRPMSIYEVHAASWKRGEGGRTLTYGELARELVPYVKQMGFTHVELMPVMEHPLDDSWGYQVGSYFAPTSRHGTPAEFMAFVDECHMNGIGVILDWVPAHFPKDDYGLGLFDGTHLYEHADPRLGVHPDWGTYIFNYGRNEVRSFLKSNALFWLEKYHADGLRMDAVASMLYLDYSRKDGEWFPNRNGGRENLEAVAFLRETADAVHSRSPGAVVIAEESTAWPGVTAPSEAGGLGFDLKWNMGWMHDTLDYFSKDPVYRKHHHNQLTFSLWYAFSEKFVLVLSHDEVVYGKGSMLSKMPGDEWQKFANLRLCYGYMFAHPGKKHLFMGDEAGQAREWDFRGAADLEGGGRFRDGLRRYVKDLNRAYKEEEPLHSLDFQEEGFEWLDFQDYENSVISFVRKGRGGGMVMVVCNMTPVPRHGYRIGVPRRGRYEEILNSDAEAYGGGGAGNMGGADSEPAPMHGREDSLALTLPPLGALYLRVPGR